MSARSIGVGLDEENACRQDDCDDACSAGLLTKIPRMNDNHATPNTFSPTVVSFHPEF